MKKLFIHATNVHVGGGRELLRTLLASEQVRSDKAVLLADARMSLPVELPDTLEVKRVTPTIGKRFEAEVWLRDNVRPGDDVLCFGNLPPLFKSRGRVAVFVQNRYLLNDVTLDGFPLKTRLRLTAERFWFRRFAPHVDAFVVQTPGMQSALASTFAQSGPDVSRSVAIIPFVETAAGYTRNCEMTVPAKGTTNTIFLYVASGEPHKNHRNLIEAWKLLASENLFPHLVLTVDEGRHPELASCMRSSIEQHGVVLDNRGVLPRNEVDALYAAADVLINPSFFESFGLPLIEARQAGLPVLAPELDYVRDVLDPEETFDPTSPQSIARAVKRFLRIANEPLNLVDGTGFLSEVFTTPRS
jgi:glycosyltransferase involved in cell wall biosynthesis